MSGTEFKLRGGAELVALLDQLPKAWANKAVRGGARAAAVVVQKEARTRVRRKSGKLAKAIKVSARVDGGLVIGRLRVDRRGKGSHGYLGWLLESGVKPHWITVPDAELPESRSKSGVMHTRATRIRKLNKAIEAGTLVINGNAIGPYVFHPGFGAYPFMRPALDAKGAEAINAMGQYIASKLTWDELKAPSFAVEEDEE